MSRCFPFPPPGYEKKPQSDHVNLPIKKHKEKKQKKEKRDREKRESKERKDSDKGKERSKDKHREQKDRKEKHRNKDNEKDKDRNKDEKKIFYQRRDGKHTDGHDDRKPGEDNHQTEDLKNAKFMEELGRRIGDEERRAGNQMGENDAGKIQGRFGGMRSSAEKEKSACNEIIHSIAIPEQKKIAMASATEERGRANEMDQNFNSAEQKRLDGMGRPMDKDGNKKIQGKEKAKEKKVDGTKGGKHKNKDGEKKHKGMDKARNKEKEKEEKMREKGEHKHKEKDKVRDNGKNKQVGSQDVGTAFPPKDNMKSPGAEGCPKRKEANGFLHENEVRPNKLPRPTSSQFTLENGNKSGQSHINELCASVRHEALTLGKKEKTLDHKEHKINGVIDVHAPSNTWRPPLIADGTENGETSKKSPHPDEKYLSQILCIPKMEEWLEFDDQEWLLSRDNLRQKPKPKLEADETPKVWAEAVQIESADVLALPYVIPY